MCATGLHRKEVGQGATDKRKDALRPGMLPVGDKVVSQTEEINDQEISQPAPRTFGLQNREK